MHSAAQFLRGCANAHGRPLPSSIKSYPPTRLGTSLYRQAKRGKQLRIWALRIEIIMTVIIFYGVHR